MLRFLQRQKAKKGFTIIELIVVIAIFAVLTAVILPQMSTQKARINEARNAAKDFYAAIQTVMNYFSVYDGRVLPTDDDNNEVVDVIRYYKNVGGNYPFDPTYLGSNTGDLDNPNESAMYIMVEAKNNHIKDLGVVTRATEGTNNDGTNNGMFRLLQRDPDDRSTLFGNILKGEIDKRVSFNDGFYYAKVVYKYADEDDINLYTIRVEYSAFCRREFPKAEPTGSYDNYVDSYLRFTKDYQLNWNSGEVCGTSAEWYTDASGKYVCTGLAGTLLT